MKYAPTPPTPRTPPVPTLLYQPRHDRQKEVDEVWDKTRLLALTGPAGSGKTHPAIYHALRDLIDRRIGKVMVGRPSVTVDEDHGFLPGTLDEKLGPWLHAFSGCVGDKNWAALRTTLNIEAVAVGMSRGITVKDAVLLIDEAQNLTKKQLKLLASRVGSGGKLILCGDFAQCDLPGSGQVPFEGLCDRLHGTRGFREVQFLADDVKVCRGAFAFAVNAALADW